MRSSSSRSAPDSTSARSRMSLTRSFSVPAPLTMALHIFALARVERARHAAGQMLGEAQDGVERRAQFIGDMLDEIGFQPVGGFQRVAAVAQRAFDAETVGDIGKGDQGGAIGQRRQGQRQDGAVAALDFAHVALLRRAGDDLLDQPVPHLAIAEFAGRASAAMVRTCGSPSSSSALMSQMRAKAALCSFSAPVRPEHRDAFDQRVERGGLHLDQGVVVGFQRQLFA